MRRARRESGGRRRGRRRGYGRNPSKPSTCWRPTGVAFESRGYLTLLLSPSNFLLGCCSWLFRPVIHVLHEFMGKEWLREGIGEVMWKQHVYSCICRMVTVKCTSMISTAPVSPPPQVAPTHPRLISSPLPCGIVFWLTVNTAIKLGLLDSFRWERGRGGPGFQQADLLAAGRFAELQLAPPPTLEARVRFSDMCPSRTP